MHGFDTKCIVGIMCFPSSLLLLNKGAWDFIGRRCSRRLLSFWFTKNYTVRMSTRFLIEVDDNNSPPVTMFSSITAFPYSIFNRQSISLCPPMTTLPEAVRLPLVALPFAPRACKHRCSIEYTVPFDLSSAFVSFSWLRDQNVPSHR